MRIWDIYIITYFNFFVKYFFEKRIKFFKFNVAFLKHTCYNIKRVIKMIDDISKKGEAIASLIKHRRIMLGLSYQALADRTGLSKSTLQRYETGDILNIPLSKVDVLANGLQTSPAYLMGLTAEVSPTQPNNNSDEQSLLALYQKLNSTGKLKALADIEDLTQILKYTEQTSERVIFRAARSNANNPPEIIPNGRRIIEKFKKASGVTRKEDF